jgi:uncharacterized protein
MMQSLRVILKLQELDMNMIRLIDLKEKRHGELEHVRSLRRDLEEQKMRKEHEVLEVKKDIRLAEGEVRECQERIKEFETKQSAIKKVDEFNALNKQLSETERSRVQIEARIAEMSEKLSGEEEVLVSISESLKETEENTKALDAEILGRVEEINKEGRELQKQRDVVAKEVDPEVLKIYDRLLSNKRDQIVVPIENRTCSGCHIVLTAQHENLVRKGERLVFCEHCSRILYWQEHEVEEETTPRRRRRRSAA